MSGILELFEEVKSDMGSGSFSSMPMSDAREQAVIDRYKVRGGSEIEQLFGDVKGEMAVENRRQQRVYAENAPPEMVAPVKEMVSNLGDRNKVLGVIRKMTPEQRQEALKLVPGIAQQLGDDRGGVVGRTLGAISRGISHGVSQPIAELIGLGGTNDEIEYIRQLDAAAAQEFNPSIASDPWYERGPLQAVEMAPWMATVVGGGGLGRAVATGAAGRVLGAGAVGGRAVGAAAKAGELAGITGAAFPGQYAQEVDQLKELGMEDGTQLRLLAGGTAAITGLIEGIVPNPFKAGKVSLAEGAVKAARQYLWNAAKQAPGEMSEEYLQGVTSGLGKHVAGWIDENAKDKSIADAFDTGWEQMKEAALPMAFLLGVPAAGGAGAAALRARRMQLEQMRSKGFISESDAKDAGIAGGSRKERLANADAEIEQLKARESEATDEVPVSPEEDIKAKLDAFMASRGAASQPAPPPEAIPPAQVPPSQVPAPEQSIAPQDAGITPSVQSPVPSTEPDTFMEYASAWKQDEAKRNQSPATPLTEPELVGLRNDIEQAANGAIAGGGVLAPATGDGVLDELKMREIENSIRSKGYEVSDLTRTNVDGVQHIGFEVTGPQQPQAPTAPPPQQSQIPTAQPAPISPLVAPVQPAQSKAGKKPSGSTVRPPRAMEPTEKGRPVDGQPVLPGDRFLTNTGRETTPYPKYGKSGEKKTQEWTIENAIAEAESRGDDFNATQFRSELETARKGKLPQASKDSATLYVFGDYIPKVPKSSLKEFKSKSPDTVSGESQRGKEVQDAPQQKKGGDPNVEVETERQAEGGQGPSKGLLNDKEGQAADKTPSPASPSSKFDTLPQKTKDIFEAAMQSENTDKLSSVLHSGNKVLRAEFEQRTGIKLPKTVNGTKEAIDKWRHEGRKTNSNGESDNAGSSSGNERQADSVDKNPKPPKGYKPLAMFATSWTSIKSPDLELQDNRDGIKELGLKQGEAVGYMVYPKRGSTKGGYWQYGTVRYEPSGSHASIQLADGTVESVGGSRLHRLEPDSIEEKTPSVSPDEESIKNMAPGAIKRADREKQQRDEGLDRAEESRLFNENFIKIVADDVSKIRKSDVYRLLSEVPSERAGNFESWLIKRRPDLAEEINESSTEILKERAKISTVAPPAQENLSEDKKPTVAEDDAAMEALIEAEFDKQLGAVEKPPVVKKGRKAPEPPKPQVETGPVEFAELKGKNAAGVTRTYRASKGEEVLLLEESKAYRTWSISEFQENGKNGREDFVVGIDGLKKAKEVAQRILEGTFDEEGDLRFDKEGGVSLAIPNAKLADEWGTGRLTRLASTLNQTGFYTNGRFLVRVTDEDKQSILKNSSNDDLITGVGPNIKPLIDQGMELVRYKDNEASPVGYRGGDISDKSVLLRNGNGGFVLLDKAYHDTIMKRHPSAKAWNDAGAGEISKEIVAYSVDGEIVGLVMPLAIKTADKQLRAMMDGKYVFGEQLEEPKTAIPIKKGRKPTEKPPTKIEQARDDVRSKKADLYKQFKEGFKDKFSSGLDPSLGKLAVEIAIAEIQDGVLTFAAFVENVSSNFSGDMIERVKPYFEMAWRVAHKRGMTKDPGGKFDDFVKVQSDETQESKSRADGNSPMGDGAGKPQGDASASGDAANEERGVEEGTGQSSDSVLPDSRETSGIDGRGSSAGNRADGNTDSSESGEGSADSADAGGGIADGTVGDQRAVNHVIGPDDNLAVSSLTESLKRNIKALEILKKLEGDGLFPDETQRKSLAQYTGWGGLSQALDSIKGERMLKEQEWNRDENWEKKWGPSYKKLKDLLSKEEFQLAQDSTENAHYTSKSIVQSLWKIAERLGYRGGRVLELGAGIGHFAGLVPSRVRGSTKFIMVERDSVSSRIAKMLYPGHDIVSGDMEEFRAVPGSVTMGIGNVPFAGAEVADSLKRYNESLNLHNYSIARHLDAVAPGGIVVAISSHNTLDSQIKQRKFLATKGELIGAIRLPNDAFADNAKTEVVTDILIFRRPRQGDAPLGVRFDQNVDIIVKTKDGRDVSRQINKYFADNPEMVLGKHSAKGSMYGADEYTVESTSGDLQEKLNAAIERLPMDILGSVKVAEKVVASDASVPFGRLEVHDGNVVMGYGDSFVPIEGKKFDDFPAHLTGKTGVSRAKDYVKLRDMLANVREVMLNENASDEDVKAAQCKLDVAYNSYVENHGNLNTRKTAIFVRDPDYYRVLALENERGVYDPESKKIIITYNKAAIFTDRVLGPQKEPDSAGTPADAMSVSIAWRGTIDSDFIGKLLGVSTQEAEAKLLDEGLAFRNPSTTELEMSDLYLSGNVRAKLEQAKISAEEDPQYERNVEALTKVLPPSVTLKKDTVRLGAAWIPEQTIQAFASQAFGTDVQLSYNANTDAWTVDEPYRMSETAKARYETARINPGRLLEETLNLRSIKIYDSVETGDYNANGKPKTTQVLNEKETQAAKHRASVLRAAFEKWVLDNPDVSQVLAKIYNDRYNNFVRTKYNGDFLVLPGANPEVNLRPYQKDAIWRIINRGTSLLAHAVGSGKTYTMIGAAMEMRRLGLARRPLLVVQNATLGQFSTSFYKMYPNANVLIANKEDLGAGKRQLFLNKISTGNWDAVVMAQSTFDNMASDPDVERAFIQDQLDLLEDSIREEGGESTKTPTVKQLVRNKKSLKNRFDSLIGSRAKKEDNVIFEDLGVDALFLDEAHAYKKPTFTTKLSSLVGLNTESSARSLATTIKVRSVQSEHNGRNVILATGTPVTNTLGEAWHMVNYVSPATNAAFASRTFDQFIGNFAQVEPTLTMNAGGQYVYKDAIVKFRNGQQLVEYINDSWDIVTPDALRAYMEKSNQSLPQLRDGKLTAITVDRTPGVANFMDYISRVYARYKSLPAKQRRELSFIPALAYGASKAATLDIRLVVPGAAEEKNSKLQVAAEQIKRIYDESSETKGAQLFFSDMKNPFNMSRLRQFMGGETIDAFEEDDIAVDDDGNAIDVDDNESGSFLYQELKKKLLAMGIPNEQIAFISDAKTDKQRQALFQRVNNGDIRVLIGSTAKMGIGVNVQEKLIALHHFDTPWLPADLEQREGRILRFGNTNKVVEILRYAMKKTLDGAIYMGTSRKQKFIWQVLNGNLEGDSFEDPSSAAMLSIEEQLAAIQDDPIFFEKIEVQNRLRELELERQSFYDAQQRVSSSLSSNRSYLQHEESVSTPKWRRRAERIGKYKEDGLLDEFSMKYGDKSFSDPKKASEFIKGKIEEVRNYVIENFDASQTIWKAGGVLELGSKQKVKFTVGPANVVIGIEPAFVTEDNDEGKSVTRATAKMRSIAYLEETGGNYVFYEGTATTPQTFFEKSQTLLDEIAGEISRSIAQVEKSRKTIAELEGLVGKQWEDQAEYDEKKSRLAEIEGQMLASGGSLASGNKDDGDTDPGADDNLGDQLRDPPDVLYQTDPDVNAQVRTKAFETAIAAQDAGIKQFDDLVAFSVRTIGEPETRKIGAYLRLVAEILGMKDVRQTRDVLGYKGMTREQAVSFAKAAFSPMLTDEQIEAGITLEDITAFGRDEIGFAPFGSTVPGQSLFQNQEQAGKVKGWTKFINATRAIIGATDKADVSTFIHEFFHPMRRFLLDRSVPLDKRAGITDEDIQALEDYAGVKNGNWTVEAEEKAAKAWEQYWFDGKSPNSLLDSLFEKISRWMKGVYKSIQEITGGQLTPEVRKLFDKLVQRGMTAEERAADTESAVPEWTMDEPFTNPVTSVKNEVVNATKLRLGLPGLVDPAAESFQEWIDEAGRLLQVDPTLGDRLIKELKKQTRPVSDIETAVLQIHYRHLNNLLTAASDRLFKAKDAGDSVMAAKARLDTDLLVNAMEEISEVTKNIGTESGRALVARRIMMEQDFSLAALTRKARIANAGEELNEDQKAEIEELARQVATLEGKLAVAEQKITDLERQKAVDQGIEEDKKRTGGRVAKSAARQKATDKVLGFAKKFANIFGAKDGGTSTLQQTEDERMAEEAESVILAYVESGVFSFGEFMANVKRDIGSEVPLQARVAFATAWENLKLQGDIPAPEADQSDAAGLTRIARQIQRSLVEAGITERDEVLSAVHESLQEILPDITKRETMDALSGYGQFSPLRDDDIAKIIRDINGQLQQLAKLDDMRNKIAPKKTGAERRTPSDEERELIREVNQMKRDGNYYVTDPETQLKTAVGAAKTALRNRIYDLNKAINVTGKPIVGSEKMDLEGKDAELDALRKKRDELTAEYKKMFPKPGMTTDQRVSATIRGLDKAIANIEEQLETGDFSPKGRAERIVTEEIEAKRARLDALREQRDAIMELQNPKMTAEERAEKAYKANLLKRIADFQDRITDGRFDPTPKKAPRELSQAELKLKKQLADVKDQFFRLAAEYRLSQMTPKERLWDSVKETSHLSRALMTSLDLSAVFRQGGPISFGHPLIAREAGKDMLQALVSEQSEFDTMQKLENHPLFAMSQRAGLNITTDGEKITRQEEAYMGRWAKWGIGKKGTKLNEFSQKLLTPVSASARAYTTFLNSARFRMFEYFVNNLGAGGQVTLDEAKVLATFINVATGRSDFGSYNKAVANASLVFFAPRYVASRFQYLAMPFYLLPSSKISGRVKKLIAMEYARHLVGIAGFLSVAVALGSLLYDDDDEDNPTVELDPRSSDFMKLRIGETRIDPLSGLSQTISFISHVASGQKKGLNGKVRALYGDDRKWGDEDMWDVLTGFVRKKLAPVPGATIDLLTGENAVGGKETPLTVGTGLFIPLAMQEIKDTIQSRGVAQGTAISMLSILGMGVGTYGDRIKYATGTATEREEQFAKDLKGMHWDTPDPSYKDFLTSDQMEQVRKRREDRKGALAIDALATPKRKDFQSDETFAKAVADRDEALKTLKAAGWGYEEVRQLLLAYWKRNHKSAYDMKAGNYVMKDGLVDRMRQLRKELGK